MISRLKPSSEEKARHGGLPRRMVTPARPSHPGHECPSCCLGTLARNTHLCEITPTDGQECLFIPHNFSLPFAASVRRFSELDFHRTEVARMVVEWVWQEFQSLDLGHKRQVDRVVKFVSQASAIGESTPDRTRSKADLKGNHRLAGC